MLTQNELNKYSVIGIKFIACINNDCHDMHINIKETKARCFLSFYYEYDPHKHEYFYAKATSCNCAYLV